MREWSAIGPEPAGGATEAKLSKADSQRGRRYQVRAVRHFGEGRELRTNDGQPWPITNGLMAREAEFVLHKQQGRLKQSFLWEGMRAYRPVCQESESIFHP